MMEVVAQVCLEGLEGLCAVFHHPFPAAPGPDRGALQFVCNVLLSDGTASVVGLESWTMSHLMQVIFLLCIFFNFP